MNSGLEKRFISPPPHSWGILGVGGGGGQVPHLLPPPLLAPMNSTQTLFCALFCFVELVPSFVNFA